METVMRSILSPRELNRLCRGLARRLDAETGCHLNCSSGRWRIVLDSDGSLADAEPVKAAVVHEMVSRGILVMDGKICARPAPKATSLSLIEAEGAESPLLRLYRRRGPDGRPLLSDMQFAAGERLRADYERAQFERRITSSFETPISDAMPYASQSDNPVAFLSDAAIAARQSVQAAFDAVGPELAGILYYVCCLAAGIENAERLLVLPSRSGKAVLSLALTRLARHYRLMPRVPSNRNAERITRWSLADFRPEIQQRPSSAPQT
jgi:hypothetical protein